MKKQNSLSFEGDYNSTGQINNKYSQMKEQENIAKYQQG